MRDRAQKTRRLVSVQGQIKRLEEWRLAELERQLAEGEAAQRDMIAALNEDHVLYDLFIDTIARRLRALAEEEGRVRDKKDAQVRRLLACAGRLKSAERIALIADRAAQRELTKKELLDLADAFTSHRDASLP